MLVELEALATRLGIALRTEPFDKGSLGGRGGLCRVRGKPVIVLDAALPVPDKIAILASALARFDLGEASVLPELRARIDAARAPRRGDAAKPATKPAPRRKTALPGLARARPRRPRPP
jgi:hypothetical protein